MEILHGGKEGARIEGGGLEGEGFVADGDGEEAGSVVEREEKEFKKGEREKQERMMLVIV